MVDIDIRSGTYFISGIDTDIGKSYATGLIAQQLAKQGRLVMTQKMIQTGSQHYADDILIHRKIMGIDLVEDDLTYKTMPMILQYPCSPHLASRLENKMIDLDYIYHCTQSLEQKFEVVLLEGAGGLYVPLNQDQVIIDYIQKHRYPIILVTCGRLGSINHTLLSIQAILNRQLSLYAVVYNQFYDTDQMIAQDTQYYLKHYLQQVSANTQWWTIPVI